MTDLVTPEEPDEPDLPINPTVRAYLDSMGELAEIMRVHAESIARHVREVARLLEEEADSEGSAG